MSYYIEKENVVLSASKVELSKDSCFWKNQCMVFAHLHRAIEILIIYKGNFRIEIDHESSVVHEGDIVLIRSDTIHQIFSLDDGESGYLVYKIKPELLLDFAEKDTGILYLLQLNYRGGKYIWRKNEIENGRLDYIVKIILSDCFEKPYAIELSVKANAILLLAELLRYERSNFTEWKGASSSSLRKIYSAVNIVNKRYYESLTARDCAAELNMCYTHFSRCFKAIIGKSFTGYLNEARINRAEKELFMTDKSITEIAYGVGFNDVSYFISTYRKIKGKTPHQSRSSVNI